MAPSSFKDVLAQFADTTTAHAPPKVASSKYLAAKGFWFIMFLTGIGVCVYFFYELINQYQKHETTTDIELQFNVLDFPAVTICNQNAYRKDRLPKELDVMMNSYLEAKRAEMFGGKDKLQEYESKQAAAAEAATTQENSTTSEGGGEGEGEGEASSGSGSKKRRRKKRAASGENLSNKDMEVLKEMWQIYSQSDMTEKMANMSWFDSVGEASSDKSILVNLTQYVASSYTDEQLMGKGQFIHCFVEMGHDIEEMVQECLFQGQVCGPQDFYRFWDMRYGNCYTFNSGLDGWVAKIANPGSTFGLSMTLYVNQNNYVPILSTEAGIRVLLHRQGQVPLIGEEGFDLSPGTKSQVSVRYVEITRKGGLYSACAEVDNSNSSLYPGNYTQKGCVRSCIQRELVKEFGCAHYFYRRPEGVSVCSTDQMTLLEEAELSLLNSGVCTNSSVCPVPCYESQYQYIISSSQWPSNLYMPYLIESLKDRGSEFNSLLKNAGRDQMTQYFLKVNIYYDNLNYYRYSERPSMELQDLIGALGGHLGLWIGMSVVSFLEVFELIIALLHFCFRHNGKINASNNDNTVAETKPSMAPVQS